jgi:hypothetical protein
MIELLLPCGFNTLEYSWVKATIDIYKLEDYSMAKKQQHKFRYHLLPLLLIKLGNGLHHPLLISGRTRHLIVR